MSKLNWNLKNANLLSLLVALTGAFIVLLPLIVVFLTCFEGEGTTAGIFPNNWTLGNYRSAWKGSFDWHLLILP
jgi:multiple sugar transport system permease protein